LLLPLGGSAIYLGTGAGGLLGGVLVAGPGVSALAPVAAVLAGAACLAAAAGRRARPRAALPDLATTDAGAR
jgi:predicted MFS family arabinose efflux permease